MSPRSVVELVGEILILNTSSHYNKVVAKVAIGDNIVVCGDSQYNKVVVVGYTLW